MCILFPRRFKQTLTLSTERLINLLKSLVETTSDLTTASDEAIKRQEAAAHVQQESLAQFKAAVRDNLRDIKSHFGSVMDQLFSAVEVNIASIYRSFSKFDKSMDAWHKVRIGSPGLERMLMSGTERGRESVECGQVDCSSQILHGGVFADNRPCHNSAT